MSTTIQKYPLLEPLPHIQRHDQLPPEAKKLAEAVDDSEGNLDTFTLVKYKDHLCILISYHNLKTGKYHCKQKDFPLKALSWFPWALEEFRKPPAEGGLHAGAMISKDVDVDGEMLAVGSSTDGYYIMNRSRNQQDPYTDYVPAKVYLSWHFLYELGFLQIWKDLGDQYDKGLL
jgi:hypothetical protein